MTPKRVLLSASAALCLAWPLASMAEPPSDHGSKPDEQGQQHGGPSATHGGAQGGGQGAGAPKSHTAGGAASGPAGVHAPPSGAISAQPETLRRREAGPAPHGGPAVHGPPPTTTPTVKSLQRQRRIGQPQAPTAVIRKAPPPAPLGGWNRPPRGPQRDQAGQQWRQGHSGWDHSAPWRRDSNWWRHDRSFRLFLGPRIGFFFIPDLGYVHVPQEYERHYWRAGDYLPNWFWRYRVRGYERYGLPRPPDGCIWVWVDNDVALIDASDGYILDIVHNAW